jgi:hypothetical protein
MTRTELTIAVAGVLAAAVLLGWVLRGLFAAMNAGPRRGLRATADLAARLHAAEEAEARLLGVERDLAAELAETRRELAEALRARDVARQEVEEIRDAYRRAARNPGAR